MTDLPELFKEIPDNCFRNAGVYTVNIPEGITRIGRYAFAGSNIVCPRIQSPWDNLRFVDKAYQS